MNAPVRSLTVQPHGDMPTTEQWELTQRMAKAFDASGLYKNIQNVAQFIVVMQTGRELGIPPGAALRSFSFIGGKPTASAEMLAALIYRDHGDQALKVTESTAERCTVEYRRKGWDSPGRITFTMDDAINADLLKGDKANANWRKYPRAMLRSRAISEAARTAFQDSILGMHTAEEMAPDSVVVTDEGEVVLDPAATALEAAEGDKADSDTAPIPLSAYHGTHARAESVPPLSERREQIKALLQADPEAVAKMPKPADQLTDEEADKTIAWLRRRALIQGQAQAETGQAQAIEGEYTEQPAAATEPADAPEEAEALEAPAPGMDAGRRAALNRFVDSFTAMADKLKKTKGPLKGDQIEGLSLMFEQGQVLVRGRLEQQADSVKPTELFGLVAKLRDEAIDELRAGETAPVDEEVEAF